MRASQNFTAVESTNISYIRKSRILNILNSTPAKFCEALENSNAAPVLPTQKTSKAKRIDRGGNQKSLLVRLVAQIKYHNFAWVCKVIRRGKIAQDFEPSAHAEKRGGGVSRKRGERGGEKRGESVRKRGGGAEKRGEKRGGWW